MKIDFKDNQSEFILNFDFYDYPSIIEAAKEFTETCWIAIMPNDELSFKIRIEPKDKEMDVRDATFTFLNYILGIMHGKIKEISS